MTLHLVNQSPFEHSTLTECLRFCAKGDSILLLENGVYAACQDNEFNAQLKDLEHIQVYALEADIMARGLAAQLAHFISLASDSDFVDLTVQHSSVQSWY
jgi:tRNA 2-thiouridine synthesizing protein B